MPDHGGDHLTLLGCWSQAASELSEFARQPPIEIRSRWRAARQHLARPAGLDSEPGQRWRLPPRLAGSRMAGLTSGFGFPALVAGHTVAVVAIFSREARERDEDLLRVTISVGDRDRQFIERKQADEALRASEEVPAAMSRPCARATPGLKIRLGARSSPGRRAESSCA